MKLLLAILIALPLFAQIQPPVTTVQSDPGGACQTSEFMQKNARTGQYWVCGTTGVWTKISPANVITTQTANPTGAACDPKSIALRTPGGALYTCANGVYAAAGGSVTPGGPTTAVQFNNAGALGGDAGFVFSAGDLQLTSGRGFVGGPLPLLPNTSLHGQIPLADGFDRLIAIATGDQANSLALARSDGFAGTEFRFGTIAKSGDISPQDGTAATANTPYLLSTIYTEWNDTTGSDPKLLDTQFALQPINNAWFGTYLVNRGDGKLGIGKVITSFPGANLEIDSATLVLGADDSATFKGDVLAPAQKSTTGVRFICIDTTGKLVSQAAACMGT